MEKAFGFRERVAIHICRGNWTRDESAALQGDYGPLLELLQAIAEAAARLRLRHGV